jgi:hypothetical protein
VPFDVGENPLGLIERVVPDENEVKLSDLLRCIVSGRTLHRSKSFPRSND